MCPGRVFKSLVVLRCFTRSFPSAKILLKGLVQWLWIAGKGFLLWTVLADGSH